jgi:hypothetical protein
LTAVRAEFRKIERPIYEGDFCWEALENAETERLTV